MCRLHHKAEEIRTGKGLTIKTINLFAVLFHPLRGLRCLFPADAQLCLRRLGVLAYLLAVSTLVFVPLLSILRIRLCYNRTSRKRTPLGPSIAVCLREASAYRRLKTVGVIQNAIGGMV